MLKIEKTLKELRDLQNTLHGLGIEMSIKDADAETKSDYEDAAMTIDIFEPCRCFAWVGMDGVIHMRWNSYPDAYTSQTCHQCGHVASESRDSQAVFHCVECGYEANADINTAKNILGRALRKTGGGTA